MNAHLRVKQSPPFYSRAVEKLSVLLDFSLEGMFGAMAGFGEIAIGAVLHGVGVAVPELVPHGVVAGLVAFVGFERTLAAVGIVVKMVADTFRHVVGLSGCVRNK